MNLMSSEVEVEKSTPFTMSNSSCN